MSNILYMLSLYRLISCDLDIDWRSIDTAQEAKIVGISDITKRDKDKMSLYPKAIGQQKIL